MTAGPALNDRAPSAQVCLANGRHFPVPSGASILDAADAAGLVLEHSCRTGRCGLCRAPLVEGDTALLRPEVGLDAADAARGEILTCCRTAVGPVSLGVHDLGALAGIARRTLPCRIAALERAAEDVLVVRLRLPPRESFRYLPGQYLQLRRGEIARSYSIANAPRPDGTLDLYVRRVPGGAMSAYWFESAQAGDLLRFTGPLGTFVLRDPPAATTIWLATGTGIAPIRAQFESWAAQPTRGPARLYWGNRLERDFFWSPEEIDGLTFVPVHSRPGAPPQARRGHVQSALLDDVADLRSCRVYASGSPAMIADARQSLVSRGLPPTHFFADPFLVSG